MATSVEIVDIFIRAQNNAGKALAETEGSLGALGKAAKAAQLAMGLVGVAAAALIAKSADDAAKYQASIQKWANNAGLGAAATKVMYNAVLQAHAISAQPLDALAHAYSTIASHGFDAAQSVNVLTVSAKLAAATGADVYQTAYQLSGILKEYGASGTIASNSLRGVSNIADVLTAAVTHSAWSMTQFVEGSKRAIGVASQYGVPLQVVTAQLAALSLHGFANASVAGSNWAGMVSRLAQPTKAAANAIVAFTNSTGVDLAGDVGRLAKDGATLPKFLADIGLAAQRSGMPMATFMRTIMPQKGYAQVLTALEKYYTDVNRITDATTKAGKGGNTNGVNAQYSAWLKTTTAQMQLLGAQFQNLSIMIGAQFLPVINKLVADAMPVVKTISDWVSKNPTLTAQILAGTAAVGLLAGGFSLLEFTLGPLVGVLAAAALPIAAIALAAGALYLAWTHDWGGIREYTKQAWAVLQPIFNNIKTLVTAVFDTFTGKGAAATKLVQSLPPNWRQAFGIIVADMQAIGAALQVAWNGIVTFFKGAMAGLEQQFKGVWEIMSGILTGGLQFLTNDIKFWVDLFHGHWQDALNDAINMLKGIGTMGKGILQGGLDILEGIIKAWVGGIEALLPNAGKKMITGFVTGIKDNIPGVKGALNFITDHIPSWKGPLDKDSTLLYPAGSAIMAGLMAGIKSRENDLKRQLSDITGMISNGVGAAAVTRAITGSLGGSSLGGTHLPAASPGGTPSAPSGTIADITAHFQQLKAAVTATASGNWVVAIQKMAQLTTQENAAKAAWHTQESAWLAYEKQQKAAQHQAYIQAVASADALRAASYARDIAGITGTARARDNETLHTMQYTAQKAAIDAKYATDAIGRANAMGQLQARYDAQHLADITAIANAEAKAKATAAANRPVNNQKTFGPLNIGGVNVAGALSSVVSSVTKAATTGAAQVAATIRQNHIDELQGLANIAQTKAKNAITELNSLTGVARAKQQLLVDEARQVAAVAQLKVKDYGNQKKYLADLNTLTAVWGKIIDGDRNAITKVEAAAKAATKAQNEQAAATKKAAAEAAKAATAAEKATAKQEAATAKADAKAAAKAAKEAAKNGTTAATSSLLSPYQLAVAAQIAADAAHNAANGAVGTAGSASGPTLIRPQSVGLGTLEANFGSTQVDFSGRASGDPSKVADASVSTANNTAQLLVETRMVRQAIEVVAGNTMPTRGGSHRRVATKPHKA